MSLNSVLDTFLYKRKKSWNPDLIDVVGLSSSSEGTRRKDGRRKIVMVCDLQLHKLSGKCENDVLF